jgi:hypothetical protein
MARNMYEDIVVRCVICGDPVPADRVAQGAITCKKEHGTLRKNMLRAQKDAKECRYCRKPSTPEERAAYMRFRRIERKQPDLLYPAEFQAWKAELDAQANPPNDSPRTVEAFAKWWNDKEDETDGGAEA